MSYYLDLTFFQDVMPLDVLPLSLEIHQKLKEPKNMYNIINENIYQLESFANFDESPKYQDRFLAMQWLSPKIIYWPSLKLLAYFGNIEDVGEKKGANMIFQNGTDYYLDWDRISIFKHIADNINAATEDEIIKVSKFSILEEEEKKEIVKYAREWLIYKEIFYNLLKLDKYLYQEETFRLENKVFKIDDFTIQEVVDVAKTLRNIYQKKQKDIQEEL